MSVHDAASTTSVESDSVLMDPALLMPLHTGDRANERCMVLYGRAYRSGAGTVYRVSAGLEAPNRAIDPSKSCKVVRSDVVASYRGEPVIGYLHTHPGGPEHPSYADVVKLPGGMLGVIWHVRSRKIIYYTNNGYMNEEQL